MLCFFTTKVCLFVPRRAFGAPFTFLISFIRLLRQGWKCCFFGGGDTSDILSEPMSPILNTMAVLSSTSSSIVGSLLFLEASSLLGVYLKVLWDGVREPYFAFDLGVDLLEITVTEKQGLTGLSCLSSSLTSSWSSSTEWRSDEDKSSSVKVMRGAAAEAV